MDNVVIRQYREGDEHVINDAFNSVFGENRSLEEWYWKFRDDPLRSWRMITLAEVQGRIVGQYASAVTLFQYKDRKFPFPQPADNYVEAEFRGGMKGIQKTMFEAQPEAVANIGSPFGLGFPNREAYIVGKRMLKYKDIGKMPVLFKLLSLHLPLKKRLPWLPSSILKMMGSVSVIGVRLHLLAAKRQRASGVRARVVEAFDPRVDQLWEKAGKCHPIIAIRDFKYLDWRYKKPGKNYVVIVAERGDELLGYAVVRIKKSALTREGYLIDLFTDQTPGVDALLVKKALSFFMREKVDFALSWMLPDKPYYATLQSAGFGVRDGFPPVNIVGDIFDPAVVEDAFIKDAKNWYLTMGDSDAY